MDLTSGEARDILGRLATIYGGGRVAWEQIPAPRWERGNFGSRYHLVYPAFAFWILMRDRPELGERFRPWLDAMYAALIEPRCWDYWRRELGEETPAIHERNLTYAGRLASFVGLYIDAFGEPPADAVEVDGEAYSYSQLSENLWRQMKSSPSCGVSCFQHASMVMCNAHLLFNNVLHDRLYGTDFSAGNAAWLDVVGRDLVDASGDGPLFFYGTQPHSHAPDPATRSDGMDAWSLFLMAGIAPEAVQSWYAGWRKRLAGDAERKWVDVAGREEKGELASVELATAWALCAARELGDEPTAAALQRTLQPKVATGFKLDPLLSGLYLLSEALTPGALNRLVTSGRRLTPGAARCS